MRTIYSLLAELERNSLTDMELTEDLFALQTLLSTFNDHVKPFRNLQLITETEAKFVGELKQRICYFLKQRSLWDTTTDGPSTLAQHQHVLRKVLLFLVYNTDTEAKEIIATGTNTSHLVGHFPPLPKCVLYHLIADLKLFPLFCEFIQFGPTDLVVHFLDSELLHSLKQMDKYHRLPILPQLIYSVYQHCYLTAFLPNCNQTALEDPFERINDFLATLCLSHVHADQEKYPDLTKSLDLDTYVGHLLRHTLGAILRCLETFLTQQGADEEVFKIFQVNPDQRVLGKYVPDEFLRNHMTALNSQLLNRIQLVLMTVSCKTFMNWMEVDVTKTVTLQRAVGELAHRLQEVLAQNEQLSHDVQSVLKGVAVKPLNAAEMAKQANIADIIEYVEDGQARDRGVWMGEFLSRGLFVLDNEECLSVVAEHVNLLAIRDLSQFTALLRDSVGSELSCLPQIVDIIVAVLMTSKSVLEVDEWLEKEEPHRLLMDYDISADKYLQPLTEFLNKLVDFDGDWLSLQPFLAVLLIDPVKAIVQVQSSCVSEKGLVGNGVKVLLAFHGHVHGYMEDILADLLANRLAEADSLKGLEWYVLEVFGRELVDQKEFLKSILFMEIGRRAGEKEKPEEILVLLRLLKGILEPGNYRLADDLKPPLIVVLGTVADVHRWDLMNYTDTAEKIVGLATELMRVVAGETIFEGMHKEFILQKAKSMKEMNRYYAEALFSRDGPTGFVEYLHGTGLATDKRRRDFLCKTFVRATMQEKERLAECKELQPHFVEMVVTVTKAVKGNEQLLVAYKMVFSGFLKVFQGRLVDELDDEIVGSFVDLVAQLPVEIYEEHSFVVNALIARVLERASDGAEDELREKINAFPESAAKAHLLSSLTMSRDT